MKTFLLRSTVAMLLLIGAAQAQTVIRVAPPAPRREVIAVSPGARYVWVGGYYRYHGHGYAWVPGRYAVPPRPYAVWVPGRWVPRHGGYVWVAGYWR
jgi:hypothetical protein